MRRADRLFQIIERLRRRGVVTARVLADQLKVSERTIYRDVADLIASQVPIEGAAGIGYSLRKGYDLPPLMFTESELDALVFGARMVRTWSDAELGQAADAALAKIEGVLPAHLQRMIEDRSLWAPADVRRMPIAFDLGRLRAAIRARHKLRFSYRDEKGAETRRKVRPLTLLVLSANLARRLLVRIASRLPLLSTRSDERRRVPRRAFRSRTRQVSRGPVPAAAP